MQNLAKSAADHCVAMRIYKEDSGKSTAKLHEPAKEAYSQFETATRFHSGSLFPVGSTRFHSGSVFSSRFSDALRCQDPSHCHSRVCGF